MITIKLDMPAGIQDKQIEAWRGAVLMALVASAHAEIERHVATGLNRMKLMYSSAIEMSPPAEVQKSGIAWIQLVGKLPNMIEQGASGWDLRTTLLDHNPKKKVGKNGNTYAYIPFTHQGPNASHSAMPANIYAEAKKLSVTTSAPGMGTKWGDGLKAGLAPKAKPHHVTDLYAGMYRMAKTYAAATQGGYRTFRTISSNKKVGWMHPGFVARRYFDKAAEYLDTYGAQIALTVPLPEPTQKAV